MTNIFLILKENKPIFEEGNINGAGFTVHNPILTTDGDFSFKKTYKNKETGEVIRDKEFLFNLNDEVELLTIDGVRIYPKSDKEEVQDVDF